MTTSPAEMAPPAPARSSAGPSWIKSLLHSRELLIFGIFIVELLIFAGLDARHGGGARFVTLDSLLLSARSVSLIGIAAVGASMVIVSGGIDLSPGAVYGLCGVVFTMLLTHPFSAPVALLGAVAMGVLFGLINGSAVAWLRIPPFIATLGTLGIARGLSFLLTNGQQLPSPERPLPDAGNRLLDALDTHFFQRPGFIGINIGFVLMIALAAFFTVWLAKTRTGRYIVAIGGSEEVARFAGVRVPAVKTLVYVLASALASLSGIIYVARYGGINSGVGPGDELNIIAAAVVGGVSLAGGKGSPIGAVIGALIIKVLNDGLVFNEVPQAGAQIAVGIFIILAVLVDRLLYIVRDKSIAAQSQRKLRNA